MTLKENDMKNNLPLSSVSRPSRYGRFIRLPAFVLFSVFLVGSSLAASNMFARSPDDSAADQITAVTRHQLSINGKVLKYTARAGFLPIRDQFGETKAQFFYIAYVLDDEGEKSGRPVTFAWNGGPGAASSLVHLGILGPRRAKFLSEYKTPPPPYELVDNTETWLQFTDLVMVDPIGTGYSYALTPEYGKMFWGVSQDVDSISEFIRIYLNRYDALDAPIFLLGESYGTFRAAGVAEELVKKRFSLRGVVMIGSILDMRAKSDVSLALIIPSYTAAAFYHKKLPSELQTDFQETLRQAETWAETEYVGAVMRGDRISADERQAITAKFARFTGLDPKFIDKKNLRVEMDQFANQLLASEKKFVGHYDSRILGENENPQGRYDPTKDPSLSSNGISNLIVPYIRSELGLKIDRPYQGPFGGFWPPARTPRGDWMAYRWDWGSILDNKLNMSAALGRAMRKKTDLHVFMASGYYDLATPYFVAENTISQMGIGAELRDHIIHTVYEGGHALYLDDAVRLKLTKDAASFYKSTLSEEGE
jgi:carboxypeptidase C (cathepsin A)